ncbi:histidine ammonia-lyase [Alicyclobacillus shizuokensis]|uniref:histidine ammonia-lyase n=1 Tax=Alicyclobacillus shizuokensis TaxID=392014 RepID=UPI00082B0689|nr:histidine ammonia-lyase [Alicyclobacillus shizuokensis]MCL6624984.1 histidine ammonia-lyase [Alicyclobacillus shizuokensis]
MTHRPGTRPQDIQKVVLGHGDPTVSELVAVSRYGAQVSFCPAYRERVAKSRALVDKFLAENRVIYGITTGFGSNVTKVISPVEAEALQRNIVRSHAVSVGAPLPAELVRATQFMILVQLGQGFSGVRMEVLDALAALLNRQVVPYVPGDGSVAYLSPEAHMALVLMGEGKAYYGGELLNGAEALQKAGLTPLTLGPKEGLSLLNGTTSTTAIAALALYDAIQATKTADIAAAMSFESLKGTIRAFDERLHQLKRHHEQAATARYLSRMLADSEIAQAYRDYRLQDALSLRCIPQLHGAVKKTLKDAAASVRNEMASVSDNPIIYGQGDDGVGLMGGNFDATFIGIAADSIAIALGNLAKMAESRIDRLVNFHVSELPDFLVAHPGLNSGYMIPQYTAAGLLSEIKALAHPATVDNIPTCAYQEDVVTFAYQAARKAYQVAEKVTHILAIELMAAAQALDFHRPLRPSSATASVYRAIRREVPTLEEDRYLYPDIVAIYDMIHEGEIVRRVEELLGEIPF